MKTIIMNAIAELANENKVFHSEADFQFQLAWMIKYRENNFEIRIEKPYLIDIKNIYIDIIIFDNNNNAYAIELKYATSQVKFNLGKETFSLKQQGATNQKRYDYYHDIQRLENLKNKNLIKNGYTILLTNNLGYLNEPKGVDKEFNFSNSHIINPGSYFFLEKAKQGTIKGRMKKIIINKTYNCKWNDYLTLSLPTQKQEKNLQFKYIMIEI